MDIANSTMVSLDVRVLMLSVLVCTVIAFFAATLLALKLCRQPLGLLGTTLYALAGAVALFAAVAVVTSLTPSQDSILVGLLLGLIVTQWLLAKHLLPRLQRRNTTAPPASAPAPWRMALIASPATAVMLMIAGFAQMAFFFSPS
jgi:hypothetical protein